MLAFAHKPEGLADEIAGQQEQSDHAAPPDFVAFPQVLMPSNAYGGHQSIKHLWLQRLKARKQADRRFQICLHDHAPSVFTDYQQRRCRKRVELEGTSLDVQPAAPPSPMAGVWKR